MPSILSCLQSIRALVESGGVDSPGSVLELFLPFLEQMCDADRNIELVLVDALSAHLLREECQLPADLHRQVQKELEDAAQPYCSAGDLDALPMDLLSHSLSFLSYQDRMPVECVCRSLFTLSRNTAIRQQTLVVSRISSNHKFAPRKIELRTKLPPPQMANLKTHQICQLTVTSMFYFDQFIHLDLPSLTTLTIEMCGILTVTVSVSPLWEFIRKHQVRSLKLQFRSVSFFEDDFGVFLRELSKLKQLTSLTIRFAHIQLRRPLPQFAVLSHIDKVELLGCDITTHAIHSLLHPGIKSFTYSGRMERNTKTQDWSIFHLPMLQELKLECGAGLNFDVLCSIIDEYGSKWECIKEIRFRIKSIRSTQLCDLLLRCTSLPLFSLHISIGTLLPGNPMLPEHPIVEILAKFAHLTEFVLHLESVDTFSEGFFQRNLIQLFHLKHRVVIPRMEVLSSFTRTGIDRGMLDQIHEWIELDHVHKYKRSFFND